MDISGENAPFILRFSKYMYRTNPKTTRGGPPRIAEGQPLNIDKAIAGIRNARSAYSRFDFNNDLPLYSLLTLKKGSLSKSNRYHFLKTAGIKLTGSLSPEDLIFALDDDADISRFENILRYSRNMNFRKSLTHMSEIRALLPEDKMKNPVTEGNIVIQLFKNEDYGRVLHFIRDGLNIRAGNIFSVGSLNIIKASINDLSKLENLTSHSLIRSVENAHSIHLEEHYIRHAPLPLDCVRVRFLQKAYPKAALIDSGVASDSLLKEWEISTESYIPDEKRNPAHGTFVCGRMLQEGEEFGGILYLNVEMMPSDGLLSINDFYRYMTDVLQKYSKTIKVYNISMGTSALLGDEFSYSAYILDILQKEYDVLFIISAGNCIPNGDAPRTLTSPAESVHSVSVGSVAHTDTNIQKKHTPSLFTRHGPAPLGFIKPDIAAYGGAHAEHFGRLKPVGVFSIGVKNELAEDIGTSHAVPMVTSKAAKLYHQYSHAFKSPDITKTLLIHDAFLNKSSKETDIYCGYGISVDGDNDENHVTYIHQGLVKPEQIVELPEIPIPPDMIKAGRVSGDIVLTLVYKTHVDIAFPHYYCMTMLDISLGYYVGSKWTSVMTAKDTAGFPKERDAQELFKWQPVKVFSRAFKNKKMPNKLLLRIIPSKRDFYDKMEDISYSFAISFISKEENLLRGILERPSDFSHILESAHDLWKTCG
jgi:hypothetical protein